MICRNSRKGHKLLYSWRELELETWEANSTWPVIFDVVHWHSQLRGFVGRTPFIPANDGIEKSGDVDEDGDQDDGQDVVPGLPGMRGELQRVADTEEPLDRDGEGHEDAASETDVTMILWLWLKRFLLISPERINECGKQESEDLASSLKGSRKEISLRDLLTERSSDLQE